MEQIPIINMATVGVDVQYPEQEDMVNVSKAIYDAFSTIGFAYLKHHGIPTDQTRRLFESSTEFFSLPNEVKQSYLRVLTSINGYSKPGQEILGEGFEHKESFDISTLNFLPEKEIPHFREVITDIVKEFEKLSMRLLELLALGLGVDESYFKKSHTDFMSDHNCTALRLLLYPPIENDIAPDDTRCSAHTDYGTFTLLLQDDCGGLEVKSRDGGWISAKPIKDTILVNIGDLMQFWSGDCFKATLHRVGIPKEERLRKKHRQSIAFFVHPVDDEIIQPIDGSLSYQPISALEHAMNRFKDTYSY